MQLLNKICPVYCAITLSDTENEQQLGGKVGATCNPVDINENIILAGNWAACGCKGCCWEMTCLTAVR